jgi:transposase InsO family protein
METNVVKERLAFVHDLESGHWSMTELCERYGVSRPTGYKWLERHQSDRAAGLADRSRAPQRCPHRTGEAQEAAIIAVRLEYGWGAKKLLRVLRTRHPSRVWPARSTVNVILERRGLLHKHRRRQKWAHPGAAPVATHRPNQVWPADFKGQFRTGDGQYCYPLTVTDHFSRRVLACQGLRSVKTVDAKPIFRALFREVGLPDAIRTDNGAPFASTGIHGLAALNGGCSSASCISASRPRVRKRTAPTSGCIASSNARPPVPLPGAFVDNSAGSTRSVNATTTSARTRASATGHRAHSGAPRHARTRNTGPILTTPPTWRSGA